MQVDGVPYRTIWLSGDGRTVEIIDQTPLPHEFVIVRLRTLEDAARAIETMQVRGAPLIGATAAYGICLAMRADAPTRRSTRRAPPARDAADRGQPALGAGRRARRSCAPAAASARLAARLSPRRRDLADEDVAICRAIGEHGLPLIREAGRAKPPGEPVNVLTHCNAGWLATVDWGTALAPSTRRRTPASRSMSGSTRRGRATRAPRSPRGSWASTASRTR